MIIETHIKLEVKAPKSVRDLVELREDAIKYNAESEPGFDYYVTTCQKRPSWYTLRRNLTFEFTDYNDAQTFNKKWG
jgi:hypothetical protein